MEQEDGGGRIGGIWTARLKGTCDIGWKVEDGDDSIESIWTVHLKLVRYCML